MKNLVSDLRATAYDKDNFPRMMSERACSVELALEAADRIAMLEDIAFTLALIDRDHFAEHDEALLDEAIDNARKWYEQYGRLK